MRSALTPFSRNRVAVTLLAVSLLVTASALGAKKAADSSARLRRIEANKSLQLDPKNDNAVERLKKLKGEAMNPKVLDQNGFTVVGIAARTSNRKEMTSEGIIGKQWARIFQEGIIEKIPNKADHNIVAVYTDYAGDYNGEYTYLLGVRVNSDATVPAGMVAKKIPSGKFAVFTSEKGPAPKVVPATWLKIDSLPKTAVGGDRVYRADYEIYDERAHDPENLQVDVYVGIK